jgi:sigma-B regulation protein RsbU (phosphoserine phosphatase)
METKDIRQRFEDIASRLGGAARKAAGWQPQGKGRQALREEYWDSVRELFTRDVTARDLWDTLAQEPRETVRYFTREIDFEALRSAPWHERFPKLAWLAFLAVAHRLSPTRRVLFAIAIPLLVVSFAVSLFTHLGRGELYFPGPKLLFDPVVPALLLSFLLVLELRDKLVLKSDLEVARQIQFGLLPFEPIDDSGYRIRSAMRPANTVGGDYFDVIELGEGRIALAIGDVAGKGMPAALLMALLQGSLRTLISAGFRGSDLLGKLNAHIHSSIPSNRLVTLFYAELDRSSGRLSCLNAGHNPPFLFGPDGSVTRVEATGVALGVLPDATFDVVELSLQPCGRLFLYTDGVTEAENAADDQYGEERLEVFLRERRSLEPTALIEGLVADVLAFCGGTRPRDDMTLLCVERVTSAVQP